MEIYTTSKWIKGLFDSYCVVEIYTIPIVLSFEMLTFVMYHIIGFMKINDNFLLDSSK